MRRVLSQKGFAALRRLDQAPSLLQPGRFLQKMSLRIARGESRPDAPNVGANSTLQLVWNGPTTAGNMFAYDYDDEYGSTAFNSACLAVGLGICAQVGNFDVKITGTLSGGPIAADFSPDNTQDGGNVAHTFVGWEGINPSGWSESIYDNHSGTTPGVMAYIFTGTHGTQTPEPATWAMMLGGFAGLGSLALARRRRKTVAAAI